MYELVWIMYNSFIQRQNCAKIIKYEEAEAKVKWSQLMIPWDWSCFGLSLLLEFLVRLKGIQISKWWHCIGTTYHLLFKCESSKVQEDMFQFRDGLSASHLPHSEEPDVLRLWMLRRSVSFHQGQIRSPGPLCEANPNMAELELGVSWRSYLIYLTYLTISLNLT
jgi:hypothetical protein